MNSQAILTGMRLRRQAASPAPTPNLLNGPVSGSPVPDEPHDWTPSGTEYWYCRVCRTRIYTGTMSGKTPWDEALERFADAAGRTCASALVMEVMTR